MTPRAPSRVAAAPSVAPSVAPFPALCVALSLWTSPAPAADAPGPHPLDAVEHRAVEHLRERLGPGVDARVEIHPLDRRLRLARCDGPLDAALVGPGRAGWGPAVVEVSCPGGAGWRARVRLDATVEREAWVLTRSVRRGETLARDMLARERLVLGGGARRAAPGTVLIDDPGPVLGHAFVRALRAGDAVAAAHLGPPVLVRRGREVRVLSDSGAVAVETRGVALGDARRDERVLVRNVRSGRRLDAIAVGADEVRVR